jgi:hypothetical protein
MWQSFVNILHAKFISVATSVHCEKSCSFHLNHLKEPLNNCNFACLHCWACVLFWPGILPGTSSLTLPHRAGNFYCYSLTGTYYIANSNEVSLIGLFYVGKNLRRELCRKCSPGFWYFLFAFLDVNFCSCLCVWSISGLQVLRMCCR